MRAMRLMWVFFVKDSRSLLRERGQVVGLVMMLVIPVVGAGAMIWSEREDRAAREAATTQEAAPLPRFEAPREVQEEAGRAAKWAMIGLAAGAGFFGSMFFGATQSLASFAGERDERTMELLMASPLSEGAVFWLKTGAALLPAVGMSYLLAGVVWVMGRWLAPLEGMVLPEGVVREGMLWALPAPAVIALLLVGLSVLASVRAETIKGAGQMLGVIMMMLYIVPMVGVFAVKQFGMNEWVSAVGRWWLGLSFGGQYAVAMSVPAGLGVVLIGLARWGFSRERMVR
ncbi:MAG: ABC transporter permease subunit [Phycisphaeraceae bacterium]|nr:ABC transporter permease subunit [Phycisphaeraceae bacterium]